MKGYYSTKEAAALIGETDEYVRRKCRTRPMPGMLHEYGRYFVPEKWVKKYAPPLGYISMNEAAQTAGVSRECIRKLVESGRLAFWRRENETRHNTWIDPVSLKAWMEQRMTR